MRCTLKRKILMFLLVGSIGVHIGFLAVYGKQYLSTPPPGPAACPLNASLEHLYTFLGLSADQLQRIETMAHGFHARIGGISGNIIGKRNALLRAIEKDATDRAAVAALHHDIALLQSEMQELVVTHILEMKSVMTPEQREKFFTAMERNFALQDFSTPMEGMH
jgi:hypothetical protein